MIVALIDSGFGLLPTAAWLRRLRPELDLLLSLDPDGAPWGPKSEDWVSRRVVAAAEVAIGEGAEVIVLPCNTATVCSSVAIWATAATTASQYQADLVERFRNGAEVVGVACLGLAESIDRGDRDGALEAIAAAAEQTPARVEGVVLGGTHYPLVVDEIAAALPAGVRLFDSSEAVAAQTLRRIDALGRPSAGTGAVRVLLSGRPGELPPRAATFDSGRELVS